MNGANAPGVRVAGPRLLPGFLTDAGLLPNLRCLGMKFGGEFREGNTDGRAE
jgi:hypothetical protein